MEDCNRNESYKLIYSNLRARAEPIRLIFAAANVPYEDHRLDDDCDWEKEKKRFPWEKIPVLEINGGDVVLAEHTAICRYLAKKFNLVGKSDLESAKCDEYVGAILDCRSHWSTYWWEKDPKRKEELKSVLVDTQIPFYFSRFEEILSKGEGPYLFGRHYTWADLHIAHTVTYFEDTVKSGLLHGYPKLKGFCEAVFAIPNIKAWVEKRPKTER